MMQIKNAATAQVIPARAELQPVLNSVAADQLHEWVRRLAVPRHFLWEPDANEEVGLWIASQLQRWGYSVQMQGEWRNVIALPDDNSRGLVLVGAHHDSVGGCPGADDNASAVAAMLACAQACSKLPERQRIGFVAFNREEEELK